jgi:DNA (cytosine-5)-methyltransferase 1
MLNGLDLFSGIGGMSIALNKWVRPVAYCEIDPYCQGVLLSRIARGNSGNAPIWDDIRFLDGKEFLNSIDIIYGGFPCQDISVAGRGKGLDGERSGLFFEIVRLAKEIKPKFIFLENVPAIRSRGGIRVITEIAKLGYDCRWCVLSAASVGAVHNRERWFLLAYAKHMGSSATKTMESSEETIPNSQKGENKASKSQRSDSSAVPPSCSTLRSPNDWRPESLICRMDDGVSFRVDRFRALGNSVCSQQAKESFEILMGLK